MSKCQIIVHEPFNKGWRIKGYLEGVSLSPEVAEPGWVGNARFLHHKQLDLGDEIEVRLNNQTLWLGRIMERGYTQPLNALDKSNPLYSYVAQGICEHFLDLPFVYTTDNIARDRAPFGPELWSTALKTNLWLHTARYIPIVDDVHISITPPSLSFQRCADCWRWFRSQTACKVVPEITPSGQVRLILQSLPLSRFVPPPESHIDYRESTYETATRITPAPPARQLLSDRTLSNPRIWSASVPTGTLAIITPQDTRHRGYINTFALSVEFLQPFTTDWITIKHNPKISVLKDSNGNNYIHIVGIYRGGWNVVFRWLINGVPSPGALLFNDWLQEDAFLIVPNVDELDVAFQISTYDTSYGESFFIADAPYLTVGNQPLSEIAQPKPIPITDNVPSSLSPHYHFRAFDVYQSGANYNIVAQNIVFPPNIIGSRVDILHNPYLIKATVVSASGSTITIEIDPDSPASPSKGDLVRIYYPTTPDAPYLAEQQYDTRYAIIDTPSAPIAPADLIKRVASPQVQLSLSYPTQDYVPLPEIGQTLDHPETGKPLPIYRIEYQILNNHLTQINIHAGSPDLTMKALLRQIKPPRQFAR